jgi:hypothetical protein
MTIFGKMFAALALISFFINLTIGYLYSENKEKLELMLTDNARVKAEQLLCEQQIEIQNETVEAMAVDYEKRLKERKTITVYDVRDRIKEVPVFVERNVTKEECNEVFHTIDSIRYLGL